MARPGSHDHLKPEVLSLFAEGKTPAEVCKTYPGIPRGTVYLWFKDRATNNSDRILKNSDNSVNTGSLGSQHRPQLSVISSPEDGIGWALLQCKDIIQAEKQRDPRTAIAAINAYFKGLELQRTENTQPETDYDTTLDDLMALYDERLGMGSLTEGGNQIRFGHHPVPRDPPLTG